MKIYDRHHKKRKKRDCGDACSTCEIVPDCGDCSPCLVAPWLLGLIAIGKPTRPPRSRPGAPGLAGIAAIRGYQRWLSPVLPTRCPHQPTCSGYGVTAVRRYGLLTGVRLTAGRIRRCDSTVPRGTVDPVP